ncbi:MAG TPA: hypothetical protein VEK57_02420 [Thermoanaerobaculia bacterium]|nr:hypothetical protein [Thermoanaerobaculia bacterium]
MSREQALLKGCLDNDSQALERFATRSYVREVQRAVRSTLERDYLRDELDAIAVLCIVHVYHLWEDIPSAVFDLHTRIRQVAIAFASNYRKQHLRHMRR